MLGHQPAGEVGGRIVFSCDTEEDLVARPVEAEGGGEATLEIVFQAADRRIRVTGGRGITAMSRLRCRSFTEITKAMLASWTRSASAQTRSEQSWRVSDFHLRITLLCDSSAKLWPGAAGAVNPSPAAPARVLYPKKAATAPAQGSR